MARLISEGENCQGSFVPLKKQNISLYAIDIDDHTSSTQSGHGKAIS
jgi:hypothetical protein